MDVALDDYNGFLPRIAGVTLKTQAKACADLLSSPHSGGYSIPPFIIAFQIHFLPRIAGVTLVLPVKMVLKATFFPA